MKNKYLDIRGFTLVGVLMAAGMSGGLATILAQLTKRQMVVQTRTETGIDMDELSQRISNILRNEQACLNTIGFQTDLSSSTAIAGITKIKDMSNRTFVVEGGVYRNNLIGIDSITLDDIVFPSNTLGVLNLEVIFIKRNQMIEGSRLVVKKYPLTVEISTDGTSRKVIRCTSHQDSSIAIAKKDICLAWKGIFNDSTQKCSSPLAGKNCPAGSSQEFLRGVDSDMNLICVSPPSLVAHPVETSSSIGKNCFLMTSYNNAGRSNIWKKTSPNPIGGVWRWERVGTFAGKRDCPSNYREYFQKATDSTNNSFELMFQYCCR